MAFNIATEPGQRLERSCGGARGDWMRVAPARGGLERSEAFFARHGFDPHRHDTYSIGATIEGVQTFRYRGIAQCSVAGQVFVLHPDETHDGRAGSREGFRYRTIYVDPRLISAALAAAGTALPLVRRPVSNDRRIAAAIAPAFDDLDRPLEELQQDQIVLALAEALAAADSSIARRPLSAQHRGAVRRARELLDSRVQEGVTSAELEAVTGLTRYAVARHFRACLGTSPYRYLVLRRLDRARDLIRFGTTLVDSALQSGFADQSHMTRQFKRAYGISPGQWAALTHSF